MFGGPLANVMGAAVKAPAVPVSSVMSAAVKPRVSSAPTPFVVYLASPARMSEFPVPEPVVKSVEATVAVHVEAAAERVSLTTTAPKLLVLAMPMVPAEPLDANAPRFGW